MSYDTERVKRVVAAYMEFSDAAAPQAVPAPATAPSPVRLANTGLDGEILPPVTGKDALVRELLEILDVRRPQVIGKVIEGQTQPALKI